MSSFGARPLVCALASIAILGGCAGGGESAAGQPSTFGLDHSAPFGQQAHLYGADWVYSTQPADNEVVVYTRPHGSLRLSYLETVNFGFSAPMGITTAPGGFWYVANAGTASILLFRETATGPKGPLAALTDRGEVPVNVAVAPDQQVIAVSNAFEVGGAAGSLSVFVSGRERPTRTLHYGTDPVLGEGVAIDAFGNCYWSFNDPMTQTGSIVEFPNCTGKGTLVQSGIAKVTGITLDQANNLYYIDQSSGVYKCDQTMRCQLFAAGFDLPTDISFDRGYQNLWVADASGYIDAVNPMSGLIEYSLEAFGGSGDPPFGIAPSAGL
jgi:hypothetical protein